MGGSLPRDIEQLQREIPGIGPYTAGAIASIAFGASVPAVDGNVIRVISRLRSIGAENPKSPSSNDLVWRLAGQLVDDQRPGDFNQAIMELGATVCKSSSPDCARCPVQSLCQAYMEVSVCQICFGFLIIIILPFSLSYFHIDVAR
jgi:A/G-specific adenine glycosylase